MQLITALLFLVAGHAARATNDAHSAALGDAARADVCACGAHFYAPCAHLKINEKSRFW